MLHAGRLSSNSMIDCEDLGYNSLPKLPIHFVFQVAWENVLIWLRPTNKHTPSSFANCSTACPLSREDENSTWQRIRKHWNNFSQL